MRVAYFQGRARQRQKGWVLDNKSGLPHGLHAVFYPLGSSWRNANVVMYMNWAVKDEVIKDIEILVKFNLSKFKDNGSPNVEARFIRTLYTEKKKEGEIWEFTGDKWGNTE